MERLAVWERLRRVNPLAWDAVLARVVFGFSLFLEQQFLSSEQIRINPWGRGLLALTCAQLVWRQLAPIGALAATAIGTVALQFWGYPLDFAGLALGPRSHSSCSSSSCRCCRQLSESSTCGRSSAPDRPR